MEAQHGTFHLDARFNPPRLAAFAHGNGIGSILQQVGQRLLDQAPITWQFQPLRPRMVVIRDVGMRIALQHKRFQHQPIRILRLDHRLGHARKGRKFIHHAPNIFHLAHNGVRALAESIRVIGDLTQIAPLQPFGGKLNGGQRVLDFMRNAPRHIRPGGLALGGLQFGNVIKGQHKARHAPAQRFGTNPRQ